MPLLQEINISAIDKEDVQKQLESIIKQINEWARLISNESRTLVIKDDSGTPRILIGYQEDGF